jgi:C4-dicarboxylate-specific signal transduction histidine kinase
LNYSRKIEAAQKPVDIANVVKEALGLIRSMLPSNIDIRSNIPDSCEPILVLSVSDTGSGIEQTIHQKIFDPYFITKAVGKGTGMGLSVVHDIVKNHRGQIYVESNSGQGSIFTILFPVISKAFQNPELP